jgi:hypothetical protein
MCDQTDQAFWRSQEGRQIEVVPPQVQSPLAGRQILVRDLVCYARRAFGGIAEDGQAARIEEPVGSFRLGLHDERQHGSIDLTALFLLMSLHGVSRPVVAVAEEDSQLFKFQVDELRRCSVRGRQDLQDYAGRWQGEGFPFLVSDWH